MDLSAPPSKRTTATRVMDKERVEHDSRDKNKVTHSASRGGAGRYKDKFHALRVQYDNVTSTHEEYRRELEVAEAKLKKLKSENELLLDAMQIAVPGQPTLLQHLQQPMPLHVLLPELPHNSHYPTHHHPPQISQTSSTSTDSSRGLNGHHRERERHIDQDILILHPPSLNLRSTSYGGNHTRMNGDSHTASSRSNHRHSHSNSHPEPR